MQNSWHKTRRDLRRAGVHSFRRFVVTKLLVASLFLVGPGAPSSVLAPSSFFWVLDIVTKRQSVTFFPSPLALPPRHSLETSPLRIANPHASCATCAIRKTHHESS